MVGYVNQSALPAISVAEKSFSLHDGVEMFARPMPQPLLRRHRQWQDETRQTQGLEDLPSGPTGCAVHLR
jgi:hypothetical protein